MNEQLRTNISLISTFYNIQEFFLHFFRFIEPRTHRILIAVPVKISIILPPNSSLCFLSPPNMPCGPSFTSHRKVRWIKKLVSLNYQKRSIPQSHLRLKYYKSSRRAPTWSVPSLALQAAFILVNKQKRNLSFMF